MSIVLRKYGGIFTPMLRPRTGRSFGTGSSPSAVLGFLFSPLVLIVLAIAFAVAWALSHGGLHFHLSGMESLAFAGIVAESNLLVEKRQEFAAKAKKLGDVVALITSPDDYGKKEVHDALGANDVASAKEKLLGMSAEVESLGRDVESLQLEEMKRVTGRRLEELKRPIRDSIPGTSLSNEPRTFGELVTGSKSWAGRNMPIGTSIQADLGENGMKTLLQTSAGWQPRTDNGTVLVDKIIRPVQVLDLFPADRTELFEIPSMEETTRTQAAAELAEDGTYAEDAFVFTRRTSPIRKIGSQIPVTDEQLDDIPGMRALLDNRLTFGLRARVDQQIMVGDGTGSNLTGLTSASNVQTQAKGADPTANAIFKAITLVRVSGRASPTHVFMHGTDYQNLRLAQNAQGDYQFGPPYAPGEATAWGLPIIQTEALTAGTAVVAAVNPMWMQIYYRKDIEVQVGFINTQFKIGEKTIRGDVRVGLWIGRGQVICKVTGL